MKLTCLPVLAVAVLLGASLIPSAQAMHFHRKPTSGRAHKVSAHGHKATKLHGQQAIDSARATQIQTALVREHYLTTEPNGVWDQASKDAMIKYQGDHGWQTKLTPDSRALISLGLGPEHASGSPVAAAASVPASPRTTGSAPAQNTAQARTLGSAISAHNSMQNLLLAQ